MTQMTRSFTYTIGALVVVAIMLWLAYLALKRGIHGRFVYVRPRGGER